MVSSQAAPPSSRSHLGYWYPRSRSLRCHATQRSTPIPTGSSSPLKAPANTSSCVGAVPMDRKITVLTAMKATTRMVRVRSDVLVLDVTKVTVVYDAPITLVIAAAQSTTPKARRPNSPAACWNAEAAGFFGSSA